MPVLIHGATFRRRGPQLLSVLATFLVLGREQQADRLADAFGFGVAGDALDARVPN